MNPQQLAQLAFAGMLSASVTACGDNAAESNKADKKVVAVKSPAKAELKNSCRGNNECKGLGGCSMSQAQLEKYAKKAGVDPTKAGVPHKCAGLNECKGLGGCKVTMAKYKKLKAALSSNDASSSEKSNSKTQGNPSQNDHSCGGKNSCKGMNGCG